MRNAFEERLAAQLGPDYQYEPLKLTYQTSHTYLLDFVDVENKVIVEGKGFFPSSDRAKMLAVKQQHPDWTIRISFTNPHKTISKASKTTYAMWCEKHGLGWEQGPMPVKKARKGKAAPRQTGDE